MPKFNFTVIIRFILIGVSIALIAWIFYVNIAPLGLYKKYSTLDQTLSLYPPERFIQSNENEGSNAITVNDNLLYFTTEYIHKFDKAKIKVVFQNNNLDQSIYLGFQDQDSWHYETKPIDQPLLDNLSEKGWSRINSTPYLYQRNNDFTSLEELLSSPMTGKVIGTFNIDRNIFPQRVIEDYNPSTDYTTINTNLREKVTFYTYVKDEMFKLNVSKQDLNLYDDADVVSIKIYKENDLVFSANIDDDGITDSSGKTLPAQEVSIENPGPGYPETGVYKVVIDSSPDNVITKLTTNLHKIVFEPPIFTISNHESYPNFSANTTPTTVYSNAKEFSFYTFHDGSEQEIKIGTQSAYLKSKEKLEVVNTNSSNASNLELTKIIIPKSDVILKSTLGYLSFSPEQYFDPYQFNIQPITETADLDKVNYIISDYNSPISQNGWKMAINEFDLSRAHNTKGKLNWILQLPGLKENGKNVVIKEITVEYFKNPMFEKSQ